MSDLLHTNPNLFLFAGDPHGKFDQICAGIIATGAKHVFILGDIEAPLSLDALIPRELGAEVYYIKGNHEHEDAERWANVINSSYGKNDLSNRVITLEGVTIGGLSGVFNEKIWIPDYTHGDHYHSLEEWALKNKHKQWFKEEYLKHSLTSIFPKNYHELSHLTCDVLLCHEAPSCHPNGFTAIDELAVVCEAKTVFHGHHHDNLDYSAFTESMGFKTEGVGLAGLKNLHGRVITPGLLDEQRLVRQSKRKPF